MATSAKTYTFPTDVEGFTAVPGADTTMTWSSATQTLSSQMVGRSKNNTNYWYLTATLSSILGIAATDSVTLFSGLAYDWRCLNAANGGNSTVYAAEITDGTNTVYIGTDNTFSAGTSTATSSSSSVDTSAWGWTGATTVTIYLRNNLVTNTGSTSYITLLRDNVTFTATYSAGGTTYYRTLTMTAAGTFVLSDAVTLGHALPATAVGTPVVSRVASYSRLLAVTATAMPALKKLVSKIMPAVALGLAGVSKGAFKTMTAVATGMAVLTKAIVADIVYHINLAATALGTAGIARSASFFRGLSAAATGVAGMTPSILLAVLVAASGAGSASLSKLIRKSLGFTAQGTAGLGKTVRKTLAVVATVVVDLTAGIVSYVSIQATAVGQVVWAHMKIIYDAAAGIKALIARRRRKRQR